MKPSTGRVRERGGVRLAVMQSSIHLEVSLEVGQTQLPKTSPT